MCESFYRGSVADVNEIDGMELCILPHGVNPGTCPMTYSRKAMNKGWEYAGRGNDARESRKYTVSTNSLKL